MVSHFGIKLKHKDSNDILYSFISLEGFARVI